MINTNYFSGIVKILEAPRDLEIVNRTQAVQFYVELPQKRKSTIASLIFWGNLGYEVKKFYKRNDYILIEGYTSLRTDQSRYLSTKKDKKLIINVSKIYPILLNTNHVRP